MKLILQVTDSDTSVIGLTNDPEIVEQIITDAWSQVRFGEEELVKIMHEDTPMYTARSKTLAQEDGFEYVDNDGNPINADGSEFDSEVVVETPMYEYAGEYMWIVKDAAADRLINASSGDYIFDLSLLFENNENLVIATT